MNARFPTQRTTANSTDSSLGNDITVTSLMANPIRSEQPSPGARQWTHWSLVCFVAAALAGLGATFGPDMTRQDFQRIKQEITQLPQGERLRLERNLQAYQKMSSEEKEYYWNLHRHVENQRMMPLVEEYMRWLETLSPFERQALRQSSEPAERIAAMEKILRDKREQEEYRLPELIARMIEQGDTSIPFQLRWLLRQHDDFDFVNPYVFSKAQLEQLVDLVLLPQLGTTLQQQMADFTGTDRVFRVLRASMSTLNNPRESWPTNRTFDHLAELQIALQVNSTDEKRLLGRPISFEQWKRIAFRRLLIRSLLVYQMQEFAQKYPVKENDLLTYFAKLDSSAQATLLDSPADYQTEALKWSYLWNTHRNESVFHKPEFREHLLNEMLPTNYPDRGPGFRSGRGGPGGSGGGPEGRGSRDDRGGRPPFPPPGAREPEGRREPPPFRNSSPEVRPETSPN